MQTSNLQLIDLASQARTGFDAAASHFRGESKLATPVSIIRTNIEGSVYVPPVAAPNRLVTRTSSREQKQHTQAMPHGALSNETSHARNIPIGTLPHVTGGAVTGRTAWSSLPPTLPRAPA